MSTTQLRRRSSVLFHSNSNQFPSKKTSLTDPVNANSGLGGEGPKYKESVCSTTPDSEIGIQHELLARINSSQSTLTSSLTMDDEHISENIVELNFFYGIVKRNLLRYQNPIKKHLQGIELPWITNIRIRRKSEP